MLVFTKDFLIMLCSYCCMLAMLIVVNVRLRVPISHQMGTENQFFSTPPLAAQYQRFVPAPKGVISFTAWSAHVHSMFQSTVHTALVPGSRPLVDLKAYLWLPSGRSGCGTGCNGCNGHVTAVSTWIRP